jgi:DNA invertase Pin-like site-specific DNA recombinase
LNQVLTDEKQKLLLAIEAVLQTAAAGQLRAVAYLRVSTEEQKKGYGITYTGKRVVKYIAKKGWTLTDVFVDEGFSGSLPWQERPDLTRLMDLARENPRPFDVVCVQEARAIGRKGEAFWPWVWKLEELGVFVAVAKGDYDNTTDEGRSRMRKDADRAEDERILIRDRTQGGIQEKAETGGWPGGRTPYGWMIENKGQTGLSRAVRDPREWGVLCRMLELATVHHRNAEGIASALNAEGKLTREGKLWSNKNVLNKLKSEAVQKAQVTFRKEKRAKKDREGNNLYGDTSVIRLPPAFTEVELKALNAALTQFSVVRKTDGAPLYALSKRITGPCGRHYTGFHRPGIRGYRCSGKQPARPGATRCSCSQVSADLIEKAVWADVCELLGDATQLRRLAEEKAALAAAGKVNYADRLAELDKKIADHDNVIGVTMGVAAAQAAAQGLTDTAAQAAIQAALKPLNDAVAELRKQRAEIAEWQAVAEASEQTAKDLQILAEEARGRLGSLSAVKRARLIQLLDVKVTLTSSVPRAHRGRPAGLPDYEVTGRVEPRLIKEHLVERSRAESSPQVSSGVIRFRLRVAASLTTANVRSLVDRTAA